MSVLLSSLMRIFMDFPFSFSPVLWVCRVLSASTWFKKIAPLNAVTKLSKRTFCFIIASHEQVLTAYQTTVMPPSTVNP